MTVLGTVYKLSYTTSIVRKYSGMNSIPVTVFIHGTHPVAPIVHLPLVHRFFRCPPGITLLKDLPDSHTKDLFTILCTKYPDSFPQEHCYAFGWSGELNSRSRQEAAHNLLRELRNIQKSYAGIPHTFRLITHSHGGNVALSLKIAAEAYDNMVPVSIDELILLACPVQVETAEYASSALFKKVYSIHSHNDILQVVDPQGLHVFLEYLKNFGLEFTLSNLKELGPLFSERHFPTHCGVIELNLKYSHRELFHIEFLLPRFIEALPSLITHAHDHTSPDELTYIWTKDT